MKRPSQMETHEQATRRANVAERRVRTLETKLRRARKPMPMNRIRNELTTVRRNMTKMVESMILALSLPRTRRRDALLEEIASRLRPKTNIRKLRESRITGARS